MPIISIIKQPKVNELMAAYRPIIFQVEATQTNGTPIPPVVYCDIYFNNVFYKTLCKTIYVQATIVKSTWQFDIADATQEYLKKKIGQYAGVQIIQASDAIVTAKCKFRSSGYNASGFIVAEGVEPIQGTGTTAPVAGTGTSSNTFFAVNSTLQHVHNQDLASHLNFYKNGTWANNAWPLTHRSKSSYKLCKNGSDFYPLIYTGIKNITCLKLFYRNKGQVAYTSILNCTLGCTLEVEHIDLFAAGVDSGTGLYMYHAYWTMVGGILPPDPNYYLFEYNDGSGWQTATVDDRQVNEVLYFLPADEDHQFRITPICANSVPGIPLIGNYVAFSNPCSASTFTVDVTGFDDYNDAFFFNWTPYVPAQFSFLDIQYSTDGGVTFQSLVGQPSSNSGYFIADQGSLQINGASYIFQLIVRCESTNSDVVAGTVNWP